MRKRNLTLGRRKKLIKEKLKKRAELAEIFHSYHEPKISAAKMARLKLKEHKILVRLAEINKELRKTKQ